MKTWTRVMALLFCNALCAGAQALELINYQGRLVSGTNLVNGTVALSLRLFPGLFSLPFAQPLYEDSNQVAVLDGLYSTFIGDDTTSGSLTNALTNATVYVEVMVNGIALSPRERIASVAYALRAQNVTGPISDAQLSTNVARLNGANQTFSGAVNFANLSNTFAGAFAGNGALLTNLAGSALALPLSLTGSNYPDALLSVKNVGGGPAIWAEATNASALAGVSWGDGNALFVANAGSGASAILLGGNVGVGTQTPGEKLAVAGRVYSADGGFRFPDGTVQETAAAGTWKVNEAGNTYLANGAAGIGTVAPSNALHLKSEFSQEVSLRFQSLRQTSFPVFFTNVYTTATVVQVAGTPPNDGGTWTNLSAIFTSDNLRAGALSYYNAYLPSSADGTKLLTITNFGVDLPTNAAGIAVKFLAEGFYVKGPGCSSACSVHSRVRYGTGSYSLWTTTSLLTNEALKNVGGESELSRSQVVSPEFGFDLYFATFDGNCKPEAFHHVYLDSITLVVSYYIPEPDTNDMNYVVGMPYGQRNLVIAPGMVASNSGVGISLQTNGYVGIGTPNPEFLLHVAGSAGKPGGGSWSTASDERLKENIRPLAGTLEKLLALHGVTFTYKDPAAIRELTGERTGLIAQEVEKVFPDWVETAPDGYKRLTVRGFEALAVEALRDLRAEKDAEAGELQRQIDELKARLDAMERR